MSEENKAIIRTFIEEALNKGNLAIVERVVAPDFVGHQYSSSPHFPPGTEGAKQFVTALRSAFPDLQVSVQEMVSEGDRVVTRWTLRGTHHGPLLGISPTGKRVEVTGMVVDRLANGKVVEEWVDWDRLGLLEQLGVSPIGSRAEASP